MFGLFKRKKKPEEQGTDWLERSPADLEILVEAEPTYLVFELRARDVKLELNFKRFPKVELRQDPVIFMENLAQQVLELRQDFDPEEAQQRLESLGADFAEKLLPEALRETLFRLESQISTVEIQSDAAWIPWEVLRVGEGEAAFFLGEAFALARWQKELPQTLFLPAEKIALIAAGKFSSTHGSDELALMKTFGRPGRDVAEIAAKPKELRRAVGAGAHDLFHFYGHGEVSATGAVGATTVMVDNDRPFVPEDLAGTRLVGSPLFFFNSCDSGRTVNGLVGYVGWPLDLIARGAGGFVGPSWAVPNEEAKLFAEDFYGGFLEQGLPIAEAARRARVAVRQRSPRDPFGLAYQVFAHPCAVCARPQPKGRDAEELGHVQACFALWRALEAGGASSTLDCWQGEPGEVFVRLEGEGQELWSVRTRQLAFRGQIEKLLELSQQETSFSLLGTFQTRSLDRESERGAAFLESSRDSTYLDPDLAKQALAGLKDFPESQMLRAAFSQGGLLARMTITSAAPETLRLSILERIRHRFGRGGSGTEPDSEALFARLAGPAVTYLRGLGGKRIEVGILLALLGGSRDEGALRRPPDLASFLRHQQELLSSTFRRQEIDVLQLFVHSKGLAFEPKEFDEDRGPGNEHDDAVSWILEQIVDNRRKFLLVLGDFGHGKSTLLRYVARHFAQQIVELELIPVYIRLRDFEPARPPRLMVESALAPYCTLTDELWRERRWLLLCDGFDEVDIYHSDRPEVVVQRFNSIMAETRKKNIQVVLSSRPILFLDPYRRALLVSELNRIVLRPFGRDQIAQWLEKWSQGRTTIRHEDLVARGLESVVETPVLLFLVALMFEEGLRSDSEKLTRSDVYRRFFDWTVSRGGLTEDNERPKHSVGGNFRQVLTEAAWLLFSHPDSRAGVLHYEVLRKEISSRLGFHDWEVDERVFVAHAFREEAPLHLEFIHQSLREYLVAERILTQLERVGVEETSWHNLLADRPLTRSKMSFLRGIIEGLPVERKRALEESLIGYRQWSKFWSYFTNEAEGSGARPKIWRMRGRVAREEEKIQERPAIGLGNLCLVVNLCFLWLGKDQKEHFARFIDPLLGKLLAFLDSDQDLFPLKEVLQDSLTDLTWGDFRLRGLRLDGLRFERVRFEYSKFEDVVFNTGSFRSCNFDAVEFLRCSFDGVELFSSSASGAIFRNCSFKGCGGKLPEGGCEFLSCTFEICDMEFGGAGKAFRGCVFDQSSLLLLGDSANHGESSVVEDSAVRLENHRLSPLPTDHHVDH